MKKLTIHSLLCLSLATQMTSASSCSFFLPLREVKIALSVRKELQKNLKMVKAILTTAQSELRADHLKASLQLLDSNADMLNEYGSTIVNFLEVRPQFNDDFVTAQQETMYFIRLCQQALGSSKNVQ